MCQYTLYQTGEVLCRSTVWKVTNLYTQNNNIKGIITEFDQNVQDHILYDSSPKEVNDPDPQF